MTDAALERLGRLFWIGVLLGETFSCASMGAAASGGAKR